MSGPSPTARTLTHLRKQGFHAEVVEQNLRHAVNKRDLFGIVDVLALRGTETLAVQVTSSSNVAHRVDKIMASPMLASVRDAGWRLVVHGWRPASYKGALPMLREVVILPGTNAGGWPEQMELFG